MERDPRKFFIDDIAFRPVNLTDVELAERFYRLNFDTPLIAQIDNGVKFQPTGYAKADAVIHEITKMMRYPQHSPGLFGTKRGRGFKGVVLHGRPGCGKTTIADSVRDECGRCSHTKLSYFEPPLALLLDGNVSNNIEKIFHAADRLRPSMVFIDEIDAILEDKKVDRLFLCIMNNLSQGVFVMVATNDVSCISEALRRPGRLELFFEMQLPSYDERKALITIMTVQWPGVQNHLITLTKATDGFSPADLWSVRHRAVLMAYERLNPSLISSDVTTWGVLDDKVDVTAEDLDKAVAEVKATKPMGPDEDNA